MSQKTKKVNETISQNFKLLSKNQMLMVNEKQMNLERGLQHLFSDESSYFKMKNESQNVEIQSTNDENEEALVKSGK